MLSTVAEFDATLQPAVLHTFPFGNSAANRGYVVEVSLVSTAPGAHVTSSVQPELEGAAWNDVVRVQLLNASGLVSANGSYGDQAERADPPDPPGRKCHEHHDGY